MKALYLEKRRKFAGGIAEDKYYFYTLSQRLCLLFLAIHSALAVLYNTMDVPLMAIINALSIGMYFGALELNLHHKLKTAWVLINIQMLGYIGLSSFILGNIGFKEMLMFLPMLFFLYPTSFKTRLSYLIFVSMFYVAVATGEIVHTPTHKLDPETFNIMNITMHALFMFGLAYFVFYIYRAVQYKEEGFKTEHKALHERYLEMEKLSFTDALTGLYNRQKVEQVLAYEIERSFRYNKIFSILLLDVDRFKSVNDTYGHHTGDSVLKEFAAILKTNLRKVDVVGRWGGEEFLIVCPETDAKGAAQLAEKLRAAIERHVYPEVSHVTASFGVGCYNRGLTAAQFVDHVDASLYKAKENGRNRVELSKELDGKTVLRVVQ